MVKIFKVFYEIRGKQRYIVNYNVNISFSVFSMENVM